jgi:hypothetical protein
MEPAKKKPVILYFSPTRALLITATLLCTILGER